MKRIVHSLFPAMAVSLLAATATAQTAPPPMTQAYDGSLETGTFPDLALIRNGNTADNTLGGSRFNDGFNGAEGDDRLVGYQGVDTYSFEPGDGADTIIDHSPEGNKIKFREVPEASVVISEVPGFNGETDRLITYADGDAIRIVGWSRLSEETQAAWTIEYFFRPKPDRDAGRPNSIVMLLSDPLSLLIILFALAMSIVPLVRIWRRRS